MGVEPFLIAGCLIFAGAQRLMRKVCKDCAQPYRPLPELVEQLGINGKDPKKIVLYKPRGCERCNNTGYRGRMAVMEALEVSDEIRDMIIQRVPETEIEKVAIENGMIPLRHNALTKVLKGESTVEEMARITGRI